MKVLTIGSDENLFEQSSVVFLRQQEYASQMEELHIIVCTVSRNASPIRAGNLFIYPTQSWSKLMYVYDAYRVGKKVLNGIVLSSTVISSQDSGESGLVGLLLARKFHLPFQVQVHTDIFSPYFGHSLLNNIRKILARYILPQATGIRVVSERISASLTKKFPEISTKISVLPIFVDIPYITSYVPKRNLHTEFPQFDFIILMASRLTKEKHIETALYALQKVVEKFPRTGLIIAGDGSERAHLQHVVTDLGIAPQIILLNWQEDLLSLFKTADVFLLTSLYEGYGMTLVEAAACGCSIITTPVGIADEIVKDTENGFICEVHDVECVSERIIELTQNLDLRQLFQSRIQDSIQRVIQTRHEYITRYITLLNTLL